MGAGYSDLYFDYADGHVGYHNALLHSGIIGFYLLFSLAASLFYLPLKILKNKRFHSELAPILRNLPLFIPCIMIINSGIQFWGYNFYGNTYLLLAIYIGISSIYIQSYIKQAHAV